MKKVFCVILLAVAVCVICAFNNKDNKQEYIRIHIIANSNSTLDKNIKLEIKNEISKYLINKTANLKTKNEVKSVIDSEIDNLNNIANELLNEKGLDYTSNIMLTKDYCPARKYSNTTISAGEYDTLLVSLGEAQGDNWWCVLYPPLCFRDDEYIKISSKLWDWIKNKI